MYLVFNIQHLPFTIKHHHGVFAKNFAPWRETQPGRKEDEKSWYTRQIVHFTFQCRLSFHQQALADTLHHAEKLHSAAKTFPRVPFHLTHRPFSMQNPAAGKLYAPFGFQSPAMFFQSLAHDFQTRSVHFQSLPNAGPAIAVGYQTN